MIEDHRLSLSGISLKLKEHQDYTQTQRIELILFFFQAEDGIRDAQESRGLGDVYKRQVLVT